MLYRLLRKTYAARSIGFKRHKVACNQKDNVSLEQKHDVSFNLKEKSDQCNAVASLSLQLPLRVEIAIKHEASITQGFFLRHLVRVKGYSVIGPLFPARHKLFLFKKTFGFRTSPLSIFCMLPISSGLAFHQLNG